MVSWQKKQKKSASQFFDFLHKKNMVKISFMIDNKLLRISFHGRVSFK